MSSRGKIGKMAQARGRGQSRPTQGVRRGGESGANIPGGPAGVVTTADKLKASRPRRARGFEHAAATIASPLAEAAARYGFAEPAVLLHWGEIAGPELAPLCRPVKVIHGRARDLSRTLLVACDGASAPIVEYRASEIIARVNAHYGYGAIARLKITQTGLHDGLHDGQTSVVSAPDVMMGMAEDAPGFQGADGRLAVASGGSAGGARLPRRAEPRPTLIARPEAERAAARRTRDIEDPALRDALARLGAYVITEPRRD
ncbi:MAG: DUF721 domain-containing protein [Pseudomonadota bacterium]